MRRAKGADGNWTTNITTLESTTKTVTETTMRPGATQAQERQTRAGLVVWEKAPGSAPTTYTYDPHGRVQTVNQHGVRTTTIGYESVSGKSHG